MQRGAIFFGSLFCAILALSSSAQAHPLYHVTVIGGAGSEAYNLNNLGQVVGRIDAGGGVRHAFLHNGSTLSDLGALASGSSGAYGINDSGVVVGSYDEGAASRVFVYSGGILSTLALPDGSHARGINDAGTIVGTAMLPDGTGDSASRAFIYDNGVFTNLGLLPANLDEASYGSAINNAGKVVGMGQGGGPNRPSYPFLYADGVMQNLGNFGGIFSNAASINDHDQIVGQAGAPFDPVTGNLYPSRAFLYEDGVMHDLGDLSPGGSSLAYDINNLGEIVGLAVTATGIRPFLYVHGAMRLLDSLLDPAAGWSLVQAEAINDLHQIAGTACKAGLCYAVRLDLANAVPEPGPMSLVVAGMLLLVVARHGAKKSRTRRDAWDKQSDTRRTCVRPRMLSAIPSGTWRLAYSRHSCHRR